MMDRVHAVSSAQRCPTEVDCQFDACLHYANWLVVHIVLVSCCINNRRVLNVRL